MPLFIFKIHLELNWTKNCVISAVGDNNNITTFKVKSKKSYFPILTLSTKGNVNLTK